MKNDYSLNSQESIDPGFEQLLFDGINLQAGLLRRMQAIKQFSVEVRRRDLEIFGGATGISIYGNLYVDMLWIAPDLRGLGWGTKVMKQAEIIGKDRGCSFATVNTMDWEALPFYQKLGYMVEFTREGFEKGSKMYFLRKRL